MPLQWSRDNHNFGHQQFTALSHSTTRENFHPLLAVTICLPLLVGEASILAKLNYSSSRGAIIIWMLTSLSLSYISPSSARSLTPLCIKDAPTIIKTNVPVVLDKLRSVTLKECVSACYRGERLSAPIHMRLITALRSWSHEWHDELVAVCRKSLTPHSKNEKKKFRVLVFTYGSIYICYMMAFAKSVDCIVQDE